MHKEVIMVVMVPTLDDRQADHKHLHEISQNYIKPCMHTVLAIKQVYKHMFICLVDISQ